MLGLRGLLSVFLLTLGLSLLVPWADAHAQSQDQGSQFDLEQNFPNPFTPGVSPTIFSYTIPRASHVTLTVYNLLAQEVVVLVDAEEGPGLHRIAWDGSDKKGELVPAGVYWYKLEAGEETALKRLRVSDSFNINTD